MAARPDTWMPFYCGDYLKDTVHLSPAEHGAYLLLLLCYWTSGRPLRDDDERLRRIARMTKEEWEKSRDTIRDFFIPDNGGFLRHKRVDEELEKANRIANAKQKAGRLGGKAKANGQAKAKQTPKQKATPSQSQSHIDSSPNGEGADAPPDADVLLFREGKELLGKNAGGFLAKLKRAFGNDAVSALETIRFARTRDSPAEYLGAVIRERAKPHLADELERAMQSL